ncbi:MAG: GAF domain-containing protein [Chitinophagaceae bacterium]
MLNAADPIKIVADLLRRISQSTLLVRGRDIIPEITKNIPAILGMRYCFVSEFIDNETTTLRTIAFTDNGLVIDNIECNVNESVGQMMINGNPFFPGAGAQRVFNAVKGIEAYAGAPILNPDNGEVMGHIAVTDPTPHLQETNETEILKILAARLGTEFV